MIIGAIDIGGTKISVGLVNEKGRLLDKRVMPTDPENGLPGAVKRILHNLELMSTLTGAILEGIGIGCTGPVDPQTGSLAVNSFLPGWEGTGLVDGLNKSLKLPLVMENDADAAVLAEGRWGSGASLHCFIYVTVSTGIGGGMLVDGQLYRGAGGAHPEIGHHLIDPSGPLCNCGFHGCWESLASGPALTRWYLDHLPAGQARPVNLDARQVCLQAEAGQSLARQAVERTGAYIGMGLANLITLFTPDRISMGGGLVNSWHMFEPIVSRIIQNSCGLVPAERTQIAPASLGPDIGLLGAAQAWFQRYS